jgi:hypothetical protein
VTLSCLFIFPFRRELEHIRRVGNVVIHERDGTEEGVSHPGSVRTAQRADMCFDAFLDLEAAGGVRS